MLFMLRYYRKDMQNSRQLLSAQKAFLGFYVARVIVQFKPSLLLLSCHTVLNFVTEYSNTRISVYVKRTAEARDPPHISRSA